MRYVALICGPPCAGKTTLVRNLARPGDLVLDLDDIAVRLGSSTRWGHSPRILAEAEQHMHHQMRRIARADHITAWVIRSLPRPQQRAHLARALRATTVHVLTPPQDVVLRRARTRPAGTSRAIRGWYLAYSVSEVDDPCPPRRPAPAPPPAAAGSKASAPSTTRHGWRHEQPGPGQAGPPRRSVATAAATAGSSSSASGPSAPSVATPGVWTAASPSTEHEPPETR